MKLPQAVALSTLLLAGCAIKAANTPSPVTTPNATQYAGQLVGSDGTAMGSLGLYALVRDPANPLTAHLVLNRTAQAQGDQYELSIRPFLKPESLQIVGSVAGPNNTTDYKVRFTHPFAMPTNLTPPATATKRVDLFIFDVNLVLTVEGTDSFFNGAVKTNTAALLNASGYRQLGPMVTPASINIANGTNTFPYSLVTKADPTGPRGDYDAQSGWTGAEYLTPTGYDVIPQGAQVDTTMRISNSIVTPLPILVMAKYMDPRAGSNAPSKRANRLPSTDPTKCRYFLPQTAGDLQSIETSTFGDLLDSSATETADITATVLDWDSTATVAASFPNQSDITQVAETSRPAQVEASIPKLKASGPFAGSVGPTSGLINEFVTLSLTVNNVDHSFLVTDPAGILVTGLLRVKDTQDFNAPKELVLDESLAPQPLPAGFEPSTRYQVITVRVKPSLAKPNITAVSPLTGISGTSPTLNATNTGGTPSTWSWDFGGGAVPNTSSLASPTVTLGAANTYSSNVTATNTTGTSSFDFSLNVTPAVPVITSVLPNSGYSRRFDTFSATALNSPTSWSWNFGGGAIPNTSTNAAPTVQYSYVGTYNGTVSASNALGTGPTFSFTYDVNNKYIKLRLRAITSSGALPAKLQNLANWNSASLGTWVGQYLNPVYANSGIQVDTTDIDFATVENPALYNIDTDAERQTLLTNYVETQSNDRLNCFVVNSFPFNPQWGGEMADAACNFNNFQRGCYIVVQQSAYDMVLMPHELGHVMALPHIRTVVAPLTPLNYNLMSYGTTDTSLAESIVSEVGGGCYLFNVAPGGTMPQLAVMNAWSWGNLP